MASWLRRLWPKYEKEQNAAGPAGPPISGRRAALEIEKRFCENMIAIPGTGVAEEISGHAIDANLIAPGGGPAACVDTGVGLALTGCRVAVFVGADGLGVIAPVLSSGTDLLAPLVVHVWLDGHPDEHGHADWHRLEGSGALLAMAATPQEAADLTVAARLAAEQTLRPVVLAIDGCSTAPISVPDWQAIEQDLGHADDLVSAPSPSQIELFGRNRRRIPAWMDPVHPLSAGAPAPRSDAAMMAAGRAILFDEEVPRLVRGALERTRVILGRQAGLLRRYSMDDADLVLVAQGAGAAAAEEAAAELRAESGMRVGVLGVTWISPFPGSDLAADLKGRQAIVVIEKTTTSPADDPPLLRRVKLATATEPSPVVSAISAGAEIESRNLVNLCRSMAQRLPKNRRGKQQASMEKHVRLDVPAPSRPSLLPRRGALEARLRDSHQILVEQAYLTRPTGSSVESDDTVVADQPMADCKPPEVLRRIKENRSTPDSLPRMWGDVLEPRLHDQWPRLPDPLVASGATPALSSALLRRPTSDPLPEILAGDCTGCGACWTACPESAIGATVIGLDALLTGASNMAGTEGDVGGALRRAHRHIARRAAGLVRSEETGVLRRSNLEEAWIWAGGKLDIPQEKRSEYDTAFEATLNQVDTLRPIVTERFFHVASRETDGSPHAEVLILAINPEACRACGICAAECPEKIITFASERIENAVAAEMNRWQAWESMDDTSGKTCARIASDPDVGRMGACLLSRHCGQAVLGSQTSPGSGERLALRLTIAAAEHHGQKKTAGLAKELERLRAEIEELLRRHLSSGLAGANIESITEALSSRKVVDIGGLASTLDRLGPRTKLDRERLLDLARLTERLQAHHLDLVHGADGLGRARFALSMIGKDLARRLVPYPEHPLFAPMLVDSSPASGAVGLGLAQGLAKRHVELIRDMRLGAMELEEPVDRPARIESIMRLDWKDLEPGDMAACPPVLLFTDEASLYQQGTALLPTILSSRLPLKIIVLDGLWPDARPSTALLGIAHQQAFVLAGSIAHSDHLARGMDGALSYPGPALIHLHTPAPDLHGFASNETLERARSAVSARAHILLRYDPDAEGALGLRLSLEGNPALESEFGELSLSDWAAGEARFEGADSRIISEAQQIHLERWAALRELAGQGGLLATRIEAEIRKRVESEHTAEIESREAQMEARIEEAIVNAREQAHAHLTEKLVKLTTLGIDRS